MTNQRLLSVFLLSVSAFPTLVHAQLSPNVTVWATGLNAPRGIRFGPDGYLYVAEAGLGGSVSTVGACEQVPAPVGPYLGGQTARISKIDSQANVSTVATGLPSTVDSMGDLMGVADLAFLDGSLYALVAGGGCSHGNPNLPNGIYKIDQTTGTWALFANLDSYLKTHPAKYENPADFEPDGSFYGMIVNNGTLLSVEPNHGQIFATDAQGNIEQALDVSASQGHIVPTVLFAYKENLYLGNLDLDARGFVAVTDGFYYPARDAAGNPRAFCFYSFESKKTVDVAPAPQNSDGGLAVSPDRSTLLYTALKSDEADLISLELTLQSRARE